MTAGEARTAINTPSDEAVAQLGRAHALRAQGRLSEAIDAYRAILAAQPRLAEAQNGLGIALIRRGEAKEATAAFRAATESSPNYPEAFNNLGNALDELGHGDRAVDAFREAIRLRPSYIKAHINLAAALRHALRPSEAETVLRTALTQSPQDADLWCGLGASLRQQNRLEDAIDAFTRAIAMRPNFPEALNDLGDAYQELEKRDEAEAAYRAAISARPNYAEAFTNLGSLLGELGRFDDAAGALRRAIELKPDLPEPRSNLGALLVTIGQGREAEAVLREVIAIKPHMSEALTNLSSALTLQNRRDEAEACCREALKNKPDFAEAHAALGETLIALGEYTEGWREFEWRWKVPTWPMKPRIYAQPEWQGEPLRGRTLLLYGEQGLGDVLQFVRYASVAAAMGGRVIVEAYRPLERLVATVPGVAQVVIPGDEPPRFDVHLPLVSAPRVVGTTLQTVPAEVPYLRADAKAAADWKARLSSSPGPRVGLVWAGDSRRHDVRAHQIDRRRSMTLAQIAPLLAIPGITFVSLQKGTSAAQLLDLPADRRPLDFMDEISDFADTAALVDNLDLVITVDTSVAHLAGAMARPVWILSRFDACWRWLQDRDDSPWYPTARLFRQTSPGDWDEVVARVAAELRRFAALPRPARG